MSPWIPILVTLIGGGAMGTLTKVGDVSVDVAKELDKIWEGGFEQRNHIFKDTQNANS